jgi:hypothetical protein
MYVDVRIGLTLYSSSRGARCELNLLLGRKKTCPLEEKMSAKKKFREDTTSGPLYKKSRSGASCQLAFFF